VQLMTIGYSHSPPHIELATFYIGNACYGIDISNIQEINKLTDATPVPLAPEYVKGILNLRGQIITVVDVAKKLGLPSENDVCRQRNMIVLFENEFIGLLVDRIGDVLSAPWNSVEKPPANVVGVQGQYFAGILKTEEQLIRILNIDAVLG